MTRAAPRTFDLIDFTRSRPPALATTQRTRDDDIRRRAALFAHLGVKSDVAEAKLKARVAWEYENLGRPTILKRLPTLVAEEYHRAGVTPAERKKKR